MKSRLLNTASAAVLAVGALVALATPAHGSPRIGWCSNADLSTGYRHSDDGMGHVWGWIVLRNRSNHTCRTGGFAGLSYVGEGNGTQIGAAADRAGGPAKAYVLRPGQRLRSQVQETRAVNYERATCRPRHVDGFRVYVPGSHASQFIAHPTTGCLNPRVHLLSEQPLQRP